MGSRGDQLGHRDKHTGDDRAGDIEFELASEKESSIGDDSVRVLDPSRSEERLIDPD